MPSLRGTVTEQNLKNAFAWESQANPRYLYFAQNADAEGFNDVAAVFRATAESKTGHAHRDLEYIEEVRDPATGKPIGLGERLEPVGDLVEAFLAGGASHARIYVDVFVGHAGDRGLQIVARGGREVACRPPPKGARRTLI